MDMYQTSQLHLRQLEMARGLSAKVCKVGGEDVPRGYIKTVGGVTVVCVDHLLFFHRPRNDVPDYRAMEED